MTIRKAFSAEKCLQREKHNLVCRCCEFVFVFSARLKYDAFIHLCLHRLINIHLFSLDQHVFPLPSDRFYSRCLVWCTVRCFVNHTDGHISVWKSGTLHLRVFPHDLCICEAFVWVVCKCHNLKCLLFSPQIFLHLHLLSSKATYSAFKVLHFIMHFLGIEPMTLTSLVPFELQERWQINRWKSPPFQFCF